MRNLIRGARELAGHGLWLLGYHAHNSSTCRELRNRHLRDAPPVGERLPGARG